MSEVSQHPRVMTVMTELEQLGASGEVRVLDGSARTAAEAAEQLGCPVGAIVNSLVFEADGQALLVLTSGVHRVDTDRVAALVGAESMARADADFVRSHTGFAIGGVSPVGHPGRLHTLVDRALAGHETIWAAAGHPNAVFPTTYDELIHLTGGEPADVG
ncbi:MAG: YbaK/EbsC family protein [Actinomycetota bacterium]|nr:YbaK/EbsC family protein [Actinomycetota bacterium]